MACHVWIIKDLNMEMYAQSVHLTFLQLAAKSICGFLAMNQFPSCQKLMYCFTKIPRDFLHGSSPGPTEVNIDSRRSILYIILQKLFAFTIEGSSVPETFAFQIEFAYRLRGNISARTHLNIADKTEKSNIYQQRLWTVFAAFVGYLTIKSVGVILKLGL